MEQEFSEFKESDKSLKHGFKDPVSHMCLACAVVASWSLTQEMAGSNPFRVITIFLSPNSVKTLRENSNEVNNIPLLLNNSSFKLLNKKMKSRTTCQVHTHRDRHTHTHIHIHAQRTSDQVNHNRNHYSVMYSDEDPITFV